MPERTVSTGDTIRLFEGTPGTTYFVTATGDIRLGNTQRFVRQAEIIPEGLDIEVTILESGAVWAFGEEQATVTYNRRPLSWQPRATDDVKEVNSDITETVSANGGTASNTVRADQGEVWELITPLIDVPDHTPSGTFADSIVIETEAESIEIGRADADGSQDVDMIYKSGEWVSGNNTRDNFPGTRITSDDGLTATYTNESNSDRTEDITIRYQFRVIRS